MRRTRRRNRDSPRDETETTVAEPTTPDATAEPAAPEVPERMAWDREFSAAVVDVAPAWRAFGPRPDDASSDDTPPDVAGSPSAPSDPASPPDASGPDPAVDDVSPPAPADRSAGELVRYEPGYERVALDPETIELSCLELLPLVQARRLRSVVFANTWSADGQVVSVAVTDPSNMETLDDLRLAFPNTELRIFVATPAHIDAVIARWEYLVAQRSQSDVVRELSGEEDEETDELEEESGKVASLVNQLLDQAADMGASDLHLEPRRAGMVVRVRIDSILTDLQEYPRRLSQAIINRIKVMASLKIEDRRMPQDGRFSREHGGRVLDCRVTTLPVEQTESVIIRILDQDRARLTLEQVGFSAPLIERFRDVLTTTPHGLFLATGPTGSGKTTSLHAALDLVSNSERKTLTIEDPVEIRAKGVTQVQVNVAAGLTFSTALRSFLRADPDVILVGEIRDRETADLAVEAAMTGHLVLSSLHSNNAADTAARLLELQVEPYLLASCFRAVVAQRLARRLCTECRRSYSPISDEFEALAWPETIERPGQLYGPAGCPTCRHTGYRGRLAVGELMVVTDDIAQVITGSRSVQDIRRLAIEGGMVPLRDGALQLVAEGMMSVEEFHRVGF